MLAERRHGQLHYRKPVIEILPKFLLPHSFIQVAIGSGNDAQIDFNGVRPANPL